jgi:hypothetical protein
MDSPTLPGDGPTTLDIPKTEEMGAELETTTVKRIRTLQGNEDCAEFGDA